MTERFMVDDAGTLIDMHTRDTFDYVSDVCSLLNELHEQNQYLKSLKWNQDCINEISISMQQIQLLEKENEQLKTQLQNTSDQRDEFHRGARENANRVGKLEKENEQLKQQLIEKEKLLDVRDKIIADVMKAVNGD